MAMPPDMPIKKGENNMTYFQYLTYMAAPIIHGYDEDINLDFTGYFETIKTYKTMGIMEWKKALELSKELNAWSEYFSELSNLMQKTFLDVDLRSNERQALISINYDPQYVSNGNRLAYQDKETIVMQQHRNIIKAFNDELSAKVKFLERSFYHCKSIGDNGHKSSFALRDSIIRQQDKRRAEKELPGYYNPAKNKTDETKSKDGEE